MDKILCTLVSEPWDSPISCTTRHWCCSLHLESLNLSTKNIQTASFRKSTCHTLPWWETRSFISWKVRPNFKLFVLSFWYALCHLTFSTECSKYSSWVNTCSWSSESHQISDTDAVKFINSLIQRQRLSDLSTLCITKVSISHTIWQPQTQINPKHHNSEHFMLRFNH